MVATQQILLATDLGASSGRLVAGRINNGRLSLEDVHRFENGGVQIAGHFQWNLLALWQNIKDALRKAHSAYGDQVVSVGVDTWGVDFGLLGKHDEILGNPYHYRDHQTDGILEKAFSIVSREEIFAATGLQFMQLNTLFQMLALKMADSALLESAHTFLMMPDLFHWLLTGEKANEQTNASTTQFYDPRSSQWSLELLRKFDLPTSMLQQIAPPGTNLGKIRGEVADETGMKNVQVVLPGTHDTASAVMAVPAAASAEKTDWCYISSGTWSLMGVEVPRPVITDRVRELNFTNEGGVGGTIRLLKNIAGLWLIQECRRIWLQQGKQNDFVDLVKKADASKPLVSLIDPDDTCFIAPKDMPQAIRDYCQQSGQPVPDSDGAIIRCALESLALRYRMVHRWLEELVGNRIDTIHIVGGGTQNQLLCQMAADACDRVVIAGPVEATAIGNVMMQAVSLGIVGSISEARQVIRQSFDVAQFEPKNTKPWEEAFQRFEKLVLKS